MNPKFSYTLKKNRLRLISPHKLHPTTPENKHWKKFQNHKKANGAIFFQMTNKFIPSPLTAPLTVSGYCIFVRKEDGILKTTRLASKADAEPKANKTLSG